MSKPIILAAQLYTLREQMKDKPSAAEALRRVAEMGYDAVQLSAVPVGAENPAWFREECDKNGLSILSTHSDFRRMREEPDALLADHKLLGCDCMGIGYMPSEFHSTEGVAAFAGIVEEIALRAADAGIRLLYHNHRFEFEKADGRWWLDILLEKAPHLSLLPDLYWVAAAGVNPTDFLEKYRGRYNQVHFKDLKIVDDQSAFCEIGQGNLDYIGLSRQLYSYGVCRFTVEQDRCDGDPFDSLQTSIRYLKEQVVPALHEAFPGDLQKTAAALEKKGYTVRVFETAEEAADALDRQIDGVSVAFGGSMTLQEMGLANRLKNHNRLVSHWDVPAGKTAEEIQKEAMSAEIYLTSANALAEDGIIVNLDGTGNRVSSTLYGHKKVIFVVGRNKLVSSAKEAVWRTRNIASPKNAQRLSRQTPCAADAERCYDCTAAERICSGLVVHLKKMGSCEMEVILINQPLGY